MISAASSINSKGGDKKRGRGNLLCDITRSIWKRRRRTRQRAFGRRRKNNRHTVNVAHLDRRTDTEGRHDAAAIASVIAHHLFYLSLSEQREREDNFKPIEFHRASIRALNNSLAVCFLHFPTEPGGGKGLNIASLLLFEGLLKLHRRVVLISRYGRLLADNSSRSNLRIAVIFFFLNSFCL